MSRALARVVVFGVVPALVALGLVLFVSHRSGQDEPDKDRPEPRVDRPGFRDAAEEAGINFRMRFLPSEQGEQFKTNLYDHGCGVAVADFDKDGHDDIYFLNQLGENKLYRNRGDGTF